MTFKTVCKRLGIKQYAERIFNSNSHGELIHIADYYMFLKIAEKDKEFREAFPFLFELIVMFAEGNWKRPESIFQHMPKMLSNLGK